MNDIKKKIKILFLVVDLHPANGVTSFAMTYFRNLDHNKFQIDFALLHDVKTPYYHEILKTGSKIYKLPSLRHLNAHIKKCKQILKNNYQIIHDNILISSLPMMYCAYKYRVPVRILQSHNTKLSEIKWKEKRNQLFLPILKYFANTYFACGKIAGEALFGSSKYTVIPNAIPARDSYFSSLTRKNVRTQNRCQNNIIIGTVGRLSLQKNPFFAIDVIKELIKKNKKIRYWWIGSGELDEKVNDYIKENNLSQYIRLFGSRNDVSSLYQAMDVFFLPSLFEGLPISAIEAQASGLPCVISNTVTHELVYTDLVYYESLHSSINEWSDALVNQLNRKVERSQYKKQLENSSYYISNSVNLLTNNYLKLLKQFNNR